MSEFITIYRVSFDVDRPLVRRYEPRIPETTMSGEDRKTPRICFSKTIEGCISAIPGDRRSKYFDEGALMVVFPFRVALDDPNLVTSDDLAQLVPDAEITHEFWYTAPVTLCGEVFQVGEFAWGNYYFASERYRDGVYQALLTRGFHKDEIAKYDNESVFDIINDHLNNDPLYWEIDSCLGDTIAEELHIPNNLMFDYLYLTHFEPENIGARYRNTLDANSPAIDF